MTLPDGYNAELTAETTNGGLDVDFPITVQGRISSVNHRISTTLGSGGPAAPGAHGKRRRHHRPAVAPGLVDNLGLGHRYPHRERSAPSAWATVREAIRGTHQDFTEAPVGRAVVLLAVPMVLEMLMESVFVVADIFFVGRLGAEAIATVGITESLMTVIYAVAIGMTIGATAIVARRVGEKNMDQAARAAIQSILLGLAVALIVGAIGVTLGPAAPCRDGGRRGRPPYRLDVSARHGWRQRDRAAALPDQRRVPWRR